VHTTQQPLPNDPFLSSSGTWGQLYQDLWGHYAINAPTAWNTALGDGIIVAVVDTGIDYNHPDIHANVIVKPGSDFIGASCFSPTTGDDPIDHIGHGVCSGCRKFIRRCCGILSR
jgi:subtilisin family serine protease